MTTLPQGPPLKDTMWFPLWRVENNHSAKMSVCQRKQLPICLSSKVVSLLQIHVHKETARRGIRENGIAIKGKLSQDHVRTRAVAVS